MQVGFGTLSPPPPRTKYTFFKNCIPLTNLPVHVSYEEDVSLTQGFLEVIFVETQKAQTKL